MREINIDELKNLPIGTTVKCEWYNKDDNYLRKTEYITILDTTTYKDNHVILWDGSDRHHLNTFIDVTTRMAEQFDTVGYKLSVIETPYEQMWNELTQLIRRNKEYFNNPSEFNLLTLHEQSEEIKNYNFLVNVVNEIESRCK